MTDTLTEPPPTLRPHERHQQLETDVFCQHCGYNLHGQPVTRDERLGVFVCRCPECGRFHPAGTGVTASSLWMNRIATSFLILWVLIVLSAVVWIVIGMGAVPMVHLDEGTYRKMVDAHGNEVEQIQVPVANTTGTAFAGGTTWQVVLKGTTQPVAQRNWSFVYTREPVTTNSDSPWNWYSGSRFTWLEFWMLTFMSAALGFTTGMLTVIFLWHWRKRSYGWTLLLPFVGSAFVCLFCYVEMERYKLVFGWAMGMSVAWAAFHAVMMLVGMRLGRPIARGLLRSFLPPRPRQHFAFLWHADGKPMPPATSPIPQPAAPAPAPSPSP